MAANLLAKRIRNGEAEVVVVSASSRHTFQPGWLYVPFGREWFPYFMRRLGERPANVGFVVRSLLAERNIS